MANDIFENAGNAEEIVGGAGRLCFAHVGQAIPTSIADVMNRTGEDYSLMPGWKDFGYTMEGISVSRGATIEEIEVDQSNSAVSSRVTGTENTISTTLAQNTIENRQIANMGAAIIETPAVYGTATTTTAIAPVGATAVPVTSVTGITAGGFVDIAGQVRRVSAVNGLNIIIQKGLSTQVASAAQVRPITQLKTKSISYGSQNTRPALMIALISQREDGTLLMLLFYHVKVSGDDVEQTFNKETRTLPLSMKAYPIGSRDGDSDIYTEIDEQLD